MKDTRLVGELMSIKQKIQQKCFHLVEWTDWSHDHRTQHRHTVWDLRCNNIVNRDYAIQTMTFTVVSYL